ncbi:MAG: LD-carboxypeptidase [Prevotellaceae bacterium]|jgi:muramoyltetrapeptide carboxypeptidase|nr:LD-carboxypeptidase [Prevotellaceae bacterium]
MFPPFLKNNSQIRIVSPAGAIDAQWIDGATKVLSAWGLHVTEGQFARGSYGRFAGTPQERIADLQTALDDNNVNAILCSRGGYGLAQIIDSIDFSAFSKNPKWLIGFSDITILHNAISRLGIASIHGIMAKHLTEQTFSADPVMYLKNILFGNLPKYNIDTQALNRTGKAQAEIIGGNLSVLCGMRGTAFDLDFANKILFIEDIGEKPYQVDRMIQNLRISGVLASLSGLIVGQFSEYEEDESMHQTMYEIIATAVSNYDYPVCFNFPAGHVAYNLPLILGKTVSFEVNETKTVLEY